MPALLFHPGCDATGQSGQPYGVSSEREVSRLCTAPSNEQDDRHSRLRADMPGRDVVRVKALRARILQATDPAARATLTISHAKLRHVLGPSAAGT